MNSMQNEFQNNKDRMMRSQTAEYASLLLRNLRIDTSIAVMIY